MKQAAKERLSRERVLDAARELVQRDGLDALSMRRLAQRLDVWPMSIYTYFRDKDELLDALAESAAEQLAVPAPGARAPWRTQMGELLDEARRVLGDDPGGLATRLPRAMLAPGLLRLSEAGLAILTRAGFGERAAASAWRALLGYTFGFALTSVGTRDARGAVAALPDEEFPALHASVAAFAEALGSDDEFRRGLDRLLDGLTP
jgi:TetR/AcrR family transcriptional regulator, tetracycline repressor protein